MTELMRKSTASKLKKYSVPFKKAEGNAIGSDYAKELKRRAEERKRNGDWPVPVSHTEKVLEEKDKRKRR
jgi:hypothetical protein